MEYRHLKWQNAAEQFNDCPFCGEGVDVFEVPCNRYEPNGKGWAIQCKTMGCMFQRNEGWQSLKNLREAWNTRAKEAE